MTTPPDIFKTPEQEADKFNTYTSLKAKFFAQDRRIYGILLLIYSPNLEYCEKSFLTLTTYSLDYNTLGANSSFEKFYEAIYNKTKEGISFQNINFKIKSTLENEFSLIDTDTKIPKIKDVIEIEQDLKSIFKKAMSDKKVTAFTFLEKIPHEDYNNFFGKDIQIQTTLESSSTANNPLSENYEVDIKSEIHIPPGAVITPASLILAPLEGKPISDLRQGHFIFISLTSDLSTPQQDSDKTIQKDQLKRVAVTGNFYFEGVHHIGIQIKENEYAIISEDANVKVKISQMEKTVSEKQITTIKKNRFRSRMLILGSILTIVLLILILFLSFIWLL